MLLMLLLAVSEMHSTSVVAAEVTAEKCFVVCPPRFRNSMQLWVEHRQRQGIAVHFVDSDRTAETVRRNLLDAGLDRDSLAVLLVGDCRLQTAFQADPAFEVPTHYRPSGPTAKFGSTDTLSGDAPYGDLDGDGVPEVAVGRFPVDDDAGLRLLIEKIIEYESSTNFGRWRDTVQITAGVGGFGMFADAAIEQATRSVLTTAVPNTARLGVTYSSPGSDFNPGPNDFFPAVLRRYQDGGMFWVYLGHGQVTELDRVPGPGGSRRTVLGSDDVELLERAEGAAPIAILLACYTGAFDASVDSLGEQMLLTPGGPVAVLAGSRVTMPYGNAIAAQGLIGAVYGSRVQRLGQAWLIAQRELATDASEDAAIAERRKLVDLLAAAVSPAADQLPEERLEHVHLYNLLGDPLLKLRHPGEVELQVARGVAPGCELNVVGLAPHAGRLRVSLCYLPGNVPVDRGLLPSEKYEQANDVEVAVQEIANQNAGEFSTTLDIPSNLRGPMRVIARIEGSDQWSIGSHSLLVRPE